MVGIINSGSGSCTRDVEDSEMARVDLYSSKLIDLGYFEGQISSVIEKLCSVAPTHYPYLLGAVLYSVLIKLYQQIDVYELKQGLESIIKESKSPRLRNLLYRFQDGLDFIIDTYLRWEFHYSNPTSNFQRRYERLFGNLGPKELHYHHHHILPPSRALRVFLKYLSRHHFLILNYLARDALTKGTGGHAEDYNKIKSFEDHLMEKIEKLEKYERENLPKLLDESVKGVIEIYEKLKSIIGDYLAYIEGIKNIARKSLDKIEKEYEQGNLSHKYYSDLYMINIKKLDYATEMSKYIQDILKMSYLIVINKVSIDKIIGSLHGTEDPLLNLKETYNLLSSEQEKLFNCEIMKDDRCTER